MPSVLPCLDNIIGLSKTACTCWNASKPVDFNALNASSSGLYVADASGIPLRWTNSAADCENGGVWQLLIDARENAVRSYISDYLTLTQKAKQEQFDPFNVIGDKYFSQSETVNETTVAAYMEPYKIKGAKITVNSVSLAFWSGYTSGSTIVQIDVYSSKDLNTSLGTALATVTANKQFFDAVFVTPLVLDLSDIRTDLNERFYFVYSIPNNYQPVQNNAWIIGCCGDRNKEQTNPYLQIMCVGGVQADSVANLNNPRVSTATMQGMVINASMECDYYSWLCNLSQTPNAVYNISNGQRLRLGMGLADGLKAAAVMFLADSILKSGRINHYSMILDDKQLYSIRANAAKTYELSLKNMVYYMPSDVTDCLICQTDSRITKSEILI